VRVTYYYDERMPLYFLTLFAKGDRANLSKAERGGFKYEVQHGLTRRETPRGVS